MGQRLAKSGAFNRVQRCRSRSRREDRVEDLEPLRFRSGELGDEMKETTRDSDVSRLQELIEHSHLKSIDYYEVSARRFETDSAAEESGNVSIDLAVRSDESEFGIRLTGTADFPLGQATVSVAGEYEAEAGFVVDERTVRHFANEVGVMTVLPYLREGVATITAKVFDSPVQLPIIPRGEITIDLEGADS